MGKRLRTKCKENLPTSIDREVISPCANLGQGGNGSPGHRICGRVEDPTVGNVRLEGSVSSSLDENAAIVKQHNGK